MGGGVTPQQLLGELQAEDRIIICDLEAGIGPVIHRSRADLVIVVTDPSAKSITVARRVAGKTAVAAAKAAERVAAKAAAAAAADGSDRAGNGSRAGSGAAGAANGSAAGSGAGDGAGARPGDPAWVQRVIVVANRVRDDADLAAITAALGEHEIVVVPEDPAIVAADRAGRAPIDTDPDAPAVTALLGLADRLGSLQPVAG